MKPTAPILRRQTAQLIEEKLNFKEIDEYIRSLKASSAAALDEPTRSKAQQIVEELDDVRTYAT